MPDNCVPISLDDLDTFGDPQDYRKPKSEKYDRLDGRTPVQMMGKIESSNKEEDHHVAHISQLHNAAELGLAISVAGLGPREKFVENAADIPNKGDHKWFFHGDDPFDVNIELKSRNFRGSKFRPKKYDEYNCTKRNIPYLLIQNGGTPEASIILLRMEDLVYIRDTYDVLTHEMRYGKPWNPYQDDKTIPIVDWKKFYKCDVFDCPERFQNRKISYEDLKRNGSYDEWWKVINYFRSVSGKQS